MHGEFQLKKVNKESKICRISKCRTSWNTSKWNTVL